MLFRILAKFHFKLYINFVKTYALPVHHQKSLTERNETDTCPLTDSKRVHVIDPTIYLLSDFFTDSLPSN